ncbi:MAG: flagellar biosynthesis protein FlhF [Pseudomonadota bacterium]|jgi:flagellar biosynthesis protein FlhF
MNVKRFTGRNSREAMQKVKAAFGDEAVVLSTKPAPEGGIEILAMAADSVPAADHLAGPAEPEPRAQATPRERMEPADAVAPASRKPLGKQARETMQHLASTVQDDVKQLAMSTLSFQDYVRERMLKRREAAMLARTEPAMTPTADTRLSQRFGSGNAAHVEPGAGVDLGAMDRGGHLREPMLEPERPVPQRAAPAVARPAAPSAPVAPVAPAAPRRAAPVASPLEVAASEAVREPVHEPVRQRPEPAAPRAQVVPLRSEHNDLMLDKMRPAREAVRPAQPDAATLSALKAAQDANANMLGELRAMREMMKERFETIAFIERLGRTPAQATLAHKLLDAGFSPVLVRKMIDAMPTEVSHGQHDEVQWATQVLQRNLFTADQEPAIEDLGGVVALVGSTGVGKTTTCAKLAAVFAAKYGAQNLGLITLDAYRVGAHDQLRAYGRILGVSVHMAHDRAALEDLLDLLSSKKLILIDTAGMAQRDGRTKELLDMLAHPSIRKLLVVNTAAQGDAIEDVMHAYRVDQCAGVILSKLDEAVKLGPALDTLIRHKAKVLGVANGQRVPEDWHRLSAQALVHRALRASLNPAYRLDPNEVSLVFAVPPTAETMAMGAV